MALCLLIYVVLVVYFKFLKDYIRRSRLYQQKWRFQNKLDDLVWQIKNLTINFSTIKALENSHSKWIATIPIDIVVFSKIIFLANVQNYTNSGIIRYKLDSIIKTLYYLANNNIQIIEQYKY